MPGMRVHLSVKQKSYTNTHTSCISTHTDVDALLCSHIHPLFSLAFEAELCCIGDIPVL